MTLERFTEKRYIIYSLYWRGDKMKYIYIQKFIVGIGILFVIFGPYYCFKQYWNYKIDKEREDFSAGVEYYTNYYKTGEIDYELQKQQEQIEVNEQRAEIIAYLCSTVSVIIGILIIKKSSKIVEKFYTKKYI